MGNPLFRLLSLSNKSFLGFLLGIVIRAIGETGVQIIFVFLMRDVFASMVALDTAILFNGLQRAGLLFLGTLAVFLLGFFVLQRQVIGITVRIRRDLYAQLHRLPVSYFKNTHSGDTVSRMTNDVNAVVRLLGELPAKFLFEIINCAASIAIIISVDYRLGLVAAVAGVIGAVANTRAADKLRVVSRNMQDSQSALTSLLSDLFSGIQIIKSYSLYGTVESSLRGKNNEVRQLGLERVKTQAVLESANFITSSLNVMGLLLVGGALHLQGAVSVPEIVMVIQAQNGVERLFQALGANITALQSSLAAAERVVAILDTAAEPERFAAMSERAGDSSSAISLQRVSFSYDASSPALTDITLNVSHGEKVALVGPSGGGKSTLLKLLLAWYEPHGGTIAIGGVSLSSQSLVEARAKMSYVPQDALLFSGTIAENIRLGKLNASEAEVIEAAKAAQAYDFIMAFERGFDEQVGEKGSELSGGQKQRIAIARAILRDAPILLLDEATAALDNESEAAVHEALDRLMQGRTSIIVAHRLATIEHADRIVVLNDGRITEQGSHAALMARGGQYFALRQAAN